MSNDVLMYKVYGFRTEADQSKPIAIVASTFAEAVYKWMCIHEGIEPFDVCLLSEAYF